MPQMICANCGLRGIPKTYTRGNTYIKVMTWPLSTFARYQGYPRCGAENMVPVDSPRGEELARTADTFEAAHLKGTTLKPGDGFTTPRAGTSDRLTALHLARSRQKKRRNKRSVKWTR